MTKNLLPSPSSGLWTTYTPTELQRPVFINENDTLSITAADYRQNGFWRCRIPVEAGKTHRFEAELDLQNIPHIPGYIRATLTWEDLDGKMIRVDYAVNETRTGPNDSHVLLDAVAEAPLGKPYHGDAAFCMISLQLWNCDSGSVSFRNISLCERNPIEKRLVRVATTYVNPMIPENKTKESRLEKILLTADRAGILHPDIVCFQEGIAERELDMPEEERYETIPGPLTEALGAKAKKYGMYIVFNLHELKDGYRHNSTVLLDRNGEVAGVYRKVHLTWNESNRGMVPGRTYPVFETDFGRIGIAVCFDHFYPESVRQLVSNGAEIVFIPTAGDAYIQAPARATDNWVPLCISGVNRNAVSPYPQSKIISQEGKVLAATGEDGTAVCTTLDLNHPPLSFWFSVGAAYANKHDIFLSECRPDTYLK